MNSSQTSNRPKPLVFDIEQWRSDIQTFVDETNDELQQIIGELYGSDSEIVRPSSASDDLGRTREVVEEPDSGPTGRRLASLKEKLAKRIHQPSSDEAV